MCDLARIDLNVDSTCRCFVWKCFAQIQNVYVGTRKHYKNNTKRYNDDICDYILGVKIKYV